MEHPVVEESVPDLLSEIRSLVDKHRALGSNDTVLLIVVEHGKNADDDVFSYFCRGVLEDSIRGFVSFFEDQVVEKDLPKPAMILVNYVRSLIGGAEKVLGMKATKTERTLH